MYGISYMFRHYIAIFRELLKINSAHKNIDELLHALKFVHKMIVNVTKFVYSSA
jgi:hypothetical protein